MSYLKGVGYLFLQLYLDLNSFMIEGDTYAHEKRTG